MLLIKEVWFEAAHKLDIAGPCGQLHGHSYKVLFEVDGPIRGNGMVIDFSLLKEITNQFDHQYLNELPIFRGEQTTAENLASKIAVECRVLGLAGKVTVWETRNNAACAVV